MIPADQVITICRNFCCFCKAFFKEPLLSLSTHAYKGQICARLTIGTLTNQLTIQIYLADITFHLPE